MDIEKNDIEMMRDDILDRINNIERAQWRANSRVRQDIYAAASSLSFIAWVTAYAVLAQWAGWKWSNWYLALPLAAGLVGSFISGAKVTQIQKQEEPQWPPRRSDERP
jgi:hypothetical protein